MSATTDALVGWPKATDVRIVNHDGMQWYRTPEGDFPRVTTVDKLIGLGTEGLIGWSAKVERVAVVEAACDAWATPDMSRTREGFAAAIQANLGASRAHQRVLSKAGDIGTEIHRAIQTHLAGNPQTKLSEPAAIAFLSWKSWWERSGRKALLVEQPVWDPVLGYAGTIDCLSDSPHPGVMELWDWKSSAGIYEAMHVQCAAYIRAANRWGIVVPGGIVRLPKDASGSLEVEVKEIGHLYDGRILSVDELFEGFKSALNLWKLFVSPRKETP